MQNGYIINHSSSHLYLLVIYFIVKFLIWISTLQLKDPIIFVFYCFLLHIIPTTDILIASGLELLCIKIDKFQMLGFNVEIFQVILKLCEQLECPRESN